MGRARLVALVLLGLVLSWVSSSAASSSPFVLLRLEKRPDHELAEAAVVAESESGDGRSFRIQLLHREAPISPLRTPNVTRKQLLLGRLKKDVLRSRAISGNIKLAANGLSASDLKPMSASSSLSSSKLSSFQSPLISGVSGGSGDYFARIGVGTPAKDVYMVADTGSDVSWLQCSPCRKCYHQQDPLFDPSVSSSFKQLTCESSICGRLKVKGCSRRKMCLYQVSYGDGSFTVGDFSTETLTFGDHQVDKVPMGCGRNNQGLFHGAAGLLGLGRGPLSFPTESGPSFDSVFSYCLPRRESTKSASLIFGPNAVPSSAKFTRLVPNPRLNTYYYVSLVGIKVGGVPLKLPTNVFTMSSRGSGGVIVDSGTAISRITSAAYEVLRDAFKSMVDLPAAPGISLFDTCYDLSSMKTARLPAVELEFEGGTPMPLPAEGILVAVDDQGTYCLAFAPEDEDFTIIGNVQQQTFRISIDNHKNQMGIAAAQC